MESTVDDKIPKERRIKTKDTEGVLDDDGFFRTPNGSFWDFDGEYFNRNGFDIHGGFYTNVLDYVPGPTWIESLGCYPEDKEKYEKEEIDEEEDDNMDVVEGMEGLDLNNLGNIGNLEGIGEIPKEFLEGNFGEESKEKGNKKPKKKKNKKDKKKKKEEDEWEECAD